jgi:predicted DNA-binding protein (MmcQ/YjbR family)
MPEDNEQVDAPSTGEDWRLTRLAAICAGFPGVERERMGVNTRFVVRKKTFAYFLDNHHGDSSVALCVKVVPGENDELIASDPERFYRPAYLGANGWVGLRLDGDEIDWDEVAAFAASSYQPIAPKRLAALVQPPPDSLCDPGS